jgi:hypothetical protein
MPVTGKLDTNIEREEEVVSEIKRTLHSLGADHFFCLYGDDPSGDLVMQFENGEKDQVIRMEVHSWPQDIFERVRCQWKF